jgi:hypothetical protein
MPLIYGNKLNHLRYSVFSKLTTTAAAASGYPTGIKAKWDANDLNALTDGASVSSWTDGVSGATNATAGGGGAPKFKASALGGKPGVLFSGNQRLSGSGTTALNNVTSAGLFSMVVIMSGIDWTNSQSQATPFSSYTGSGSYRPVVGSKGPCYQDSPGVSFNTGSGLHVAVFQSQTGANSEQFNFFDGTAFMPGQSAAFSNDFCIGGYSNDYGSGFFKGTIHKLMFYDRLLTQVEVLQIQKTACDEYNQPYPWAGRSTFQVYSGDSITYGLNASSFLAAYPNVAAKTLGRGAGTYSALGFSGFGTGALNSEAAKHIDGMSAITGIPTTLMFFEWYNDAKFGGNGDTHAGVVSYVQNRLSADPSVKIVLGTSTDTNSTQSQSWKAQRATFNAYFDNSANRANLAGYAPIHNNANIGVVGSAPASGTANTYFQSDSIHLVDAGYAELANVFVSAIQAAGLS